MAFDILMQEVNQSCITDEMIDAVLLYSLPSLILHMIEWFKNLASRDVVLGFVVILYGNPCNNIQSWQRNTNPRRISWKVFKVAPIPSKAANDAEIVKLEFSCLCLIMVINLMQNLLLNSARFQFRFFYFFFSSSYKSSSWLLCSCRSSHLELENVTVALILVGNKHEDASFSKSSSSKNVSLQNIFLFFTIFLTGLFTFLTKRNAREKYAGNTKWQLSFFFGLLVNYK